MSFAGADLSAIARMRRLLQRFAAPHPGLRLIATEVESHIAALQPNLTGLNPQVFGGLSGAVGPEQAETPPARSPQRRARSTESKLAFEPRLPRDPAALPVRKLPNPANPAGAHLPADGTNARAKPIDALTGARPRDPASLDPAPGIARTQPDAALRETIVPATTQARKPNELREISGARRDTTNASGAGAAPEAQGANAKVDARVDVGALAQRVLDKRQLESTATRQSVAQNSEAARTTSKTKRIVLPVSLGLPIPQSPPVLPAAPQPAAPQDAKSKPVIPLPGTRRARPIEQPAGTVTPRNPPVEARSPEQPMRVPTQLHVPQASAFPGFLFDAFEELGTPSDNDSNLTQRIDQILREQARRQGVDLT